MAGKGNETVIAIAGNPNSGKTTLFNALTGSSQRTGNWPGVTVEKKSGMLRLKDTTCTIVDLPGIYSLSSHSEDEKVARDYLLSGESDLVLNIVDASNLERNLFLTLNLIEMKIPVILILNMIDLAGKKGITIDPETLSKELSVPVFTLNATSTADVQRMIQALPRWIEDPVPSTCSVSYPQSIEKQISAWQERLAASAKDLNADTRWFALKILEQDAFLGKKASALGIFETGEVEEAVSSIEQAEQDAPDAVIASAKYELISSISSRASRRNAHHKGGAKARRTADAIDRIVLHRIIGIPIFLLVMYAMFWTVINIGGAFIDFFDILFGAVFVDALGQGMNAVGAPQWLTALLADGIGAGIQTVATFIPIMFFMFLVLSLLEDSGYMARAAFVMDRALRAIGLPGKAFIPMIVGFGCTVPAIMATRTLENKRDRYVTVFMAPFMSCGARLPVYALFGAAFFGSRAGLMVMSLYLAGIVLAIGTGLMLKNTLFRGEPAPFVMELPPWHIPNLPATIRYTWMRLKDFIVRAGKVIVIVVALLGILNSIGTDGSFGNQNKSESLLTAAGKAVSPVFAPMGLKKDNWPAAVGMFTGLFAKEAVVGTLNGLYGQMAAFTEDTVDESSPDEWSFTDAVIESLASIPEAFAELGSTLVDPLGIAIIGEDETTIAEEVEADNRIFDVMRSYFANDTHAVYAYLLFILIYFPCFAALGAIIRELGAFFGWICVTYLTLLAWITSTLYYQIAAGHEVLWILLPILLLAGLVTVFHLLRTRITRV